LEAHNIETEINSQIKNDYEKLTTPNMAFITFEEEEGM